MGEEKQRPEEQYTKKEARAIAFGATMAALLVAGVFILGILLFLLFCTFVWFR